MSKSIRDMVSYQERIRLRKVRNREEPEAQRAIAVIYKGAVSAPDVTVQFNEDLRLDGLWGALLSAEDYEENGHFVSGTVEGALKAALNK